MKQNISTLMDGELSGDEAEMLLGRIKRHPDAQQEWLTYHLIGDAMRQPDYLPNNMNAAFFERLHAEPTVLAPHSQRNSRAGFFCDVCGGIYYGNGFSGMAIGTDQYRAGASAGSAAAQ